jgi:hypothetical protein
LIGHIVPSHRSEYRLKEPFFIAAGAVHLACNRLPKHFEFLKLCLEAIDRGEPAFDGALAR